MPERAARAGLRLAAVLLAGLLAGLAPPAAGQPAYQDLQVRIIEIAGRIQPSVVHIEAILKVNDRRSQTSGSGLVASADGRILTNQHVVEHAEKVTVSVPGRKKKYPARVVGADRQTDVALLRIDPDEPLPAPPFGTSTSLRVGQWVLAVGNPYGLDGTVSFGIVSAKGRNLEIPDLLNDFIQTDAMIDRGSSGGPLVDLDGRVVGINSRGQGRGIGFTIPIETALDVMAQLEKGGIERGYLGITMQSLDRDLADYFGMPELTGAVVNSVAEDSPAARAGIAPGDILTRFNGVAIEAEKEEDLGSFQRLVAGVAPGEEARLEVVQRGRRRSLEVVLAPQPSVDPAEAESDLGFHVQEITPLLARRHRLASEEGVFVHFVASGSPAQEAGLQVGDVIERIEDVRVKDLADLRRALDASAERVRLLITARRSEETRFMLVRRGAAPAGPDEPGGGAGEAGLPGAVR